MGGLLGCSYRHLEPRDRASGPLLMHAAASLSVERCLISGPGRIQYRTGFINS